MNAHKRSSLIRKVKINDPKQNGTSGNFYYVMPLSLYLSTSAILTTNNSQLFSFNLAKVLFEGLIDNFLD